ncbi:hypothetical protein E4U59_006044 [Claviceps monticola]|nr:hypothetical protein E4U59_006044 [Claviceps monticola]
MVLAWSVSVGETSETKPSSRKARQTKVELTMSDTRQERIDDANWGAAWMGPLWQHVGGLVDP